MWFENVGTFIEYGFQHIIPNGPDHVLFVIALYLNARGWGPLLLQVSTFTLAHTLTLTLAATGLLSVSGEIVEPLIAVSIVVLAIEAILFRQGRSAWRLPVIFAFGMLHGLGFGSQMAGALQTADMSAGLVGITVGVELGHLLVLVATGAGVVCRAARPQIGPQPQSLPPRLCNTRCRHNRRHRRVLDAPADRRDCGVRTLGADGAQGRNRTSDTRDFQSAALPTELPGLTAGKR